MRPAKRRRMADSNAIEARRDGRLCSEPPPVFRGNDFPTVTGTIMLNARGQLRDATTGALIGKLPGRVGPLGVVIGHHLITHAQDGGWHGDDNNRPGDRSRDDRMTFGVFTVIDLKAAGSATN